MIVVAVPVKDLVNAKQRLTAVLAPGERAALARAMLRDVLHALSAARVDDVWVVTRDVEVTRLAHEFRCRVVGEDTNRGHTAAVASAQREALARGADAFVTIPGDVPCVTGAEMDALVAAVGRGTRGVAFTPSRSGLGTNGAALRPPDLLPLRFGEPSFDDHLGAAKEAGLAPSVVHLRGLGLDVDTPSDLHAVLLEGPHTETGRLVQTWPIADRLLAVSASRDRR